MSHVVKKLDMNDEDGGKPNFSCKYFCFCSQSFIIGHSTSKHVYVLDTNVKLVL